MSFLLDSNICSAHLRRPGGLAHRFIQHSGRLAISTLILAELKVWAEGSSNPGKVHAEIKILLEDVTLLDFDAAAAEMFGQVKASLSKQGIAVPVMDLLIGSTALAHNLTLVTHNVSDFSRIPNLRVVDWISTP